MPINKRNAVVGAVVVAAALLGVGAVGYLAWNAGAPGELAKAAAVDGSAGGTSRRAAADPLTAQSVELSDQQLTSVKVEAVSEREFPIEKSAVGSIDFNQDMTLEVFTPYQGRIISLFAQVGDDVKKGQVLFTIDSPDLLQAESTLISAAGVLDFTTRNLERLRELYRTRAVSQKDYEQAVSDQQTAEGALRAARDAVRIFGKTDTDIDQIIAKRLADPTLVVPSPISGRVTARNAAPGLFVQPGNAPAPYSVADISTMWMLANVTESDSPAFRVGQDVKVSVMAYPGRTYEGKVKTIGAMVDPNTRRVLVRSEIADPRHELRSGMFATFVIRTGEPVRSLAIPLDGVVREGDGTMTAWVTTDRRRFVKRTVKVGLERDGYRQILDGLRAGELVATEGALFLSNALITANR
jgi:cobalt-zinc-cadmium efflux system membrane fusion protein